MMGYMKNVWNLAKRARDRVACRGLEIDPGLSIHKMSVRIRARLWLHSRVHWRISLKVVQSFVKYRFSETLWTSEGEKVQIFFCSKNMSIRCVSKRLLKTCGGICVSRELRNSNYSMSYGPITKVPDFRFLLFLRNQQSDLRKNCTMRFVAQVIVGLFSISEWKKHF